MRLIPVFVAFFSVARVVAQTQSCNNAPSLCSRAYDDITHLGAHDSPYVRNETNNYSAAGDQVYTTLQQLDAGVRLVTAQVHNVTGTDGVTQWRLCHTLCQLYDAGYLVDWLKDIKGWLDDNPNDVVTILLVNSDDADAATLGGIYQSAGLDQYSYLPSSTTQAQSQWPTLGEMISQNKRLVNFIASLNPSENEAAPYLLDEFTFVFENNYENLLPTSFSCDPDRPSDLDGNISLAISSNRLPLMNHFRYDNVSGFEVPSMENANLTNAPYAQPGNLGDAADNCTQRYGRAPTFILTDFFNVGPALETVDRLNGVLGATSVRLALPESIDESIADPSPTSSTSLTGPTSTSSGASGSSSGTSSASTTATSSSTTSTPSGSSGANHLRAPFFDSVMCLPMMFCTLGIVIGMSLLA